MSLEVESTRKRMLLKAMGVHELLLLVKVPVAEQYTHRILGYYSQRIPVRVLPQKGDRIDISPDPSFSVWLLVTEDVGNHAHGAESDVCVAHLSVSDESYAGFARIVRDPKQSWEPFDWLT